MKSRLKAGSLTTVIARKDKKGDKVETVFKFTLKGGQPEIAVPEKMAKLEGS